MTQTATYLSGKAIYSLTKQTGDYEPILVQVVEFQQKKDKYYVLLSDGSFMTKALLKDQQILDPNTDLYAIISIKSHMMGRNNIIGVMDFEKIFNYKAKIGNPQEFNGDSINPESYETFKLEKSMIDIKLQSSPIREQTTLKQQPAIIQKNQPTTIKKQILQFNQNPQTQRKFNIPPPAKPLNGSLKDYETIKTLYIGMERWTIVCRIVKLEYSEFVSKKSGKDTKVLNIELMDRTGMKISGAFFGESAQKFRNQLIKDRVYKISQGQIRQQSYNNSKNDKMSPYKLVFTNLSQFEEVSDTSSIAKNQDSAITLGDCVEKRILAQEFDIICILVNIEETVQVKKEEKPLKKTNLLVADPVKGITLHAVLWNDNLIPDRSLIGKALILSRFKLSEYKNTLNLGSVYKSSIIPVESHRYQQLESQTMKQYTSYEKLHELKSSSYEYEEVSTTIRQLERKIENLGYDQWTRADLTVYINKFNLKKWHFDGCSHCGKSAESFNNCSHCHKYVEKTVGHFIMGIEICDSTGSLWTTAYDELAKKIFNVADQTQIIDYLSKLQATQLKEQTEFYLFQQFRLRISTKKDNEGRIKHNVGKIYERNLIDETFKNIDFINKLSIS